MTSRPSAPVRLLAALAFAAGATAPAAAGAQRHAPADSGATPAVAVPRPAPPPPPAPAPSQPPGARGARDSGSDRGTARSGDGGDQSQPGASGGSGAAGRRRGNLPATGDAVARTSPPRLPHEGGGGTTIVGYPWWYGGGYFGGYYAYDPWPGWYLPDDPVPPGPVVAADGALKLKVKPADAAVYVDGYYVGIVDDFNGLFQRLTLAPGAYLVEITAPGYETLSFDVMIQPGQTTTYRGELARRLR